MGFFKYSQKKALARTIYDHVKQTKKENFTYLNNEIVKKGQTVFAGDSITEIYNITDYYAEYSKETGLAVYNRGISGDTSNRLLERLYDNVLSIEPKNIVYLIGTNDLGAGLAVDFVENNIKQILEQTKSKCPNAKIIVEGVYPVKNAGRRHNSDILELNKRIKNLCTDGIIYVDLTDLLKDENGKFNDKFTYDGLHPNAQGFNEVTKVILPLLLDN